MSFLFRMNAAALQSAKDRAASQPRADIGQILPTLGTVAGTIFGGPIGGAIGGGLGGALGGAIDGGSSSGGTTALNNGLTAAEVAELGQQAATGDANEVSSLVNTAKGAIGNNTTSALQEFLKLAQAYGPSPALQPGVSPATLGAAPMVGGIGSSAKVAPAAGGSVSGGVNAPTPPSVTANDLAPVLTAAGVPTAGNTASLTPQQQAAITTAGQAAAQVAQQHGTDAQINAAATASLTNSGVGFTPAELSAAQASWQTATQPGGGSGKWGNGAPETAAWDADMTNAILGAAGSTPAAAPPTAAPVVAPGAATPPPAAVAAVPPANPRAGALAGAIRPQVALRGAA